MKAFSEMPDDWHDLSTDDKLSETIVGIASAIGYELTLVEESVIRDDGYVTATAEGARREPDNERQDSMGPTYNVIVKIMSSVLDSGEKSTWALVFFYINRIRVAPKGKDYATLSLARGGKWFMAEWESDVYDEWSELALL